MNLSKKFTKKPLSSFTYEEQAQIVKAEGILADGKTPDYSELTNAQKEYLANWLESIIGVKG